MITPAALDLYARALRLPALSARLDADGRVWIVARGVEGAEPVLVETEADLARLREPRSNAKGRPVG